MAAWIDAQHRHVMTGFVDGHGRICGWGVRRGVDLTSDLWHFGFVEGVQQGIHCIATFDRGIAIAEWHSS